MKPTIPCKLEKNKALGAQTNFADTFNWLVDFCNNLRGEDGIVVDTSNPEHPKIKREEDDEDGSSGDVDFVSAPDSNVIFTKLDDGKIMVGVYYI